MKECDLPIDREIKITKYGDRIISFQKVCRLINGASILAETRENIDTERNDKWEHSRHGSEKMKKVPSWRFGFRITIKQRKLADCSGGPSLLLRLIHTYII